MRTALLVVATGWRVAQACSCGPPMPICTRIDRSAVLFIGDILDSNDDKTGAFSQLTLERVRVVEIFKGLPEGTKEVWLNPGSQTDCYAEVPVGRRYLIDGVRVVKAPAIAEQSRNYRGERRPLPAGFDPATSLVVLKTLCGRSAPATPQNEDIRFLEAYKANRWRPRISGLIDQLDWVSAIFKPHLPVEQARIRLTGAVGERETVTDSSGAFQFSDIAPGHYGISMEKSGFSVDAGELTVPERGCGWWRPNVKSGGRLRIRVTTAAGAVAPRVPVSILYETAGKLHGYGRDELTDESGYVEFSKLPAATYVIGVNTGGPRFVSAPYPASFYPGVREASRAERISIAPDESRAGLAMVLPAEIPTRRVQVRVVNKDGKPVVGATVFTAHSDVAHTDSDGIVVLSAFLSEYDPTVKAWEEFDTDEGKKPWVDWKRWVAEEKLPAQRGDAKVEIRFEKWVRNGDR